VHLNKNRQGRKYAKYPSIEGGSQPIDIGPMPNPSGPAMVPASSVKNWLAKQVQDQPPRVLRLGRGRYRLV
jgi:hypothetical protein